MTDREDPARAGAQAVAIEVLSNQPGAFRPENKRRPGCSRTPGRFPPRDLGRLFCWPEAAINRQNVSRL
jgi:hypothetical protein